jgi:uncharacterized membrane protein YphA (DoxX/SURF4 family)
MTLVSPLARPMLAAIFVASGVAGLRDPEPLADRAKKVTDRISTMTELPLDARAQVRVNAAVQIAGGLLLASSKMPRLAALVLAASLVPTSLAGHPFWEDEDPAERAAQRTHFLKNVGLLGGLLLAATETHRERLTWRERRVLRRASAGSASD